MAKYLDDADRDFRKLVEELDGHQASIAALLGVTQQNVSARLRTEKHGSWWRAFRRKRAKRRKAEGAKRYRRRARERMAQVWPGPQGT